MKNILLYISAFVPMYILILLKLIVELINKNLRFNILNSLIFILMIFLIILGAIGIIINLYYSNEKNIEILVTKSINITDKHFLGYFSLFVLFALTFDLTKVSMFCVSVLIMICIGIVYVTNSMYYINPFLNILGYKFYEVTYKIKGDNIEHKTKIFYKGNYDLTNKICIVKIKNENFSFLSGEDNKK